ncbi:MAG: hypothetical protein RLZZ04_4526 [Cyanobacteriota bacterium]|jgi:branched-chain amino acid transport system substrate-binding protein
MTIKSLRKIPPIFFIIVGLLIAFGFHRFINLTENKVVQTTSIINQSVPSRFSRGENLLILENVTEEKKKGIESFTKKNYPEAISFFEQSLRKNPNDPETVIYLENAQVASGNPISIAAVVPIGSNLDVAQEMLRGIAQAQAEFNSQGGNLQVQIVNDENDPEITTQVARKLVNDQTIIAVIGSNASNASLAAAPIYQNAGLVMITPTSTANELSNFGNHIFRAAPTSNEMAEALAEYTVKTARKKKIAICFDSQAPDNVAFKDEFVPALIAQGGTYVDTPCDLFASDFNGENAINSLISSGAEALLVAPHIDRLDRAIDLARANQWKMLLLGTFSLDTKKITESGQGDLNGVVLPVPFHHQVASAQTFVSKADRQWGIKINWRTATSYDATRAVIEAVTQNPDQNRDHVAFALHEPNFAPAGANGNVQFLPSGDRIIKPVLVKMKASPGKGYYFELLSTE